jgi:hypothetical protein
MSWYVSYRSGSSMITNVFKTKDGAIGAAHRLLDIGCDDEIEVGSVLEPLEHDILNADDLRRIYHVE